MKRILLDPLATDGGAATELPPAAPAATPAPAAPTSTPPPEPSGTPPPTPPAAPAAPPAPESDDPFIMPKKASAAAPKPGAPVEPDIDKVGVKELRERAKQLREENAKYPNQIKALEDKIKFFESKGADTTALEARLTAIEAERDSAQAELRALRQEASPEFKEKYDAPFNRAAAAIKSQISELTVTDAEGVQRPAKWEDFTVLYGMPVGKAIEQANAMFGPAANFVLQKRENLLDMNSTRQAALEKEKAEFKVRSEREAAEKVVKRNGVLKTWEDTNKRLAETVDDYKVDSQDAEAAEARQHALAVFDKQIDSTDENEYVKQKILKDAHIRQRVGAYAVQKVQIERLKAEKAALQAQIDELKGVAPGKPQRQGGGDAPAPENDSNYGSELIRALKAAG